MLARADEVIELRYALLRCVSPKVAMKTLWPSSKARDPQGRVVR
jgi:hypothetical protein